MKKIISLFGLLIIVMSSAQNRVGINIDQPTEALDVNGNMRIRDLVDARGNENYNRFVFAIENSTDTGVLGYKTEEEINDGLYIYEPDHVAQGLNWSTNSTRNGAQTVFDKKMIFGANNDLGITTQESWNRPIDYFEAKEGDFLDVSSVLSFRVKEVAQGTDINSISPNGDRQVIIHILLYKDTELVRKIRKVVNFNGRNDVPDRYENLFTEDISLNYLVPEGGRSLKYNVTVVVDAKAPNNGNFGLDFDSGLKQILLVTKS